MSDGNHLVDEAGNLRYAITFVLALDQWKGCTEALKTQTEFTVEARIQYIQACDGQPLSADVDIKTFDPSSVVLAVGFYKWAPEGSVDLDEMSARVDALMGR